MLLLLSVVPRGQVPARLPPTAAQMGSRDCVAGSVAIWAAAQDQMKEPFSLFCLLCAWDSQVSVLTVPKSPWPLPSPHWTGLQGRWKPVSVASVTSSAECHKYKGFWQSCFLANYILYSSLYVVVAVLFWKLELCKCIFWAQSTGSPLLSMVLQVIVLFLCGSDACLYRVVASWSFP